jgi:hypothetical protein
VLFQDKINIGANHPICAIEDLQVTDVEIVGL